MFTGIVEEIGRIAGIQRSAAGWSLRIYGPHVLEDVRLGDSIAVNGTCLTVTQFDREQFSVDVAPETRKRTNLSELRQGDAVNLERALLPTTRMGGHMVQGHVDGLAKITEKRSDGEALWLRFAPPAELMRYLVPKGFVCLDGTSLTVVSCEVDSFDLMLVPHTQTHTILARKAVGDDVNMEVDILGKYVERFLVGYQAAPASLTMDTLTKHGFADHNSGG